MYIPPFFVQPSLSKMHDLMRAYPFAVLISADPTGSIDAQHLPVILNTGENAYGTMFLHVAAANPVAQRLCSDRPVTVVFTGAHAYISPDWYESDGKVPTWNFMAVHAQGCPRRLDDQKLMEGLEDLTAHSEAGLEKVPWSVAGLDPVAYENLCGGIVGFSIEIERLEGKWKVGQNHSVADRRSAAASLRHVGGSSRLEIAEAMIATADKESQNQNHRE